MKNLLRWMGNVNNKMKQKHKKAINHENIDVNRSKTLQVLEQLKSENPNHMHPYPGLSIQSNNNMDRTGNSHQTPLIPHNDNVIINHKFSSAPQLQSTMTSDNLQIRKVLKDGRIVEEVVSCDNIDKCDNVVHVKANNSKYQQQSSDLSEQNETDIGISTSWKNTECDDIDLNVPSESNKAEWYAEEDEPLTIEDMMRLSLMGQKYTPAQYDAYVNCPDKYMNDAKIIVERLEKPPYNFKLFLPNRQLLGGGYDLEAKSKMVENRCSGKVISLLGKYYTDSEACQFINYFAKSLDPVSKEAKLIPVLINEIDIIPRIMKGMYLIRYNKDSDRGFFWDKLSNSIKNCKESRSCPSRLNRIT